MFSVYIRHFKAPTNWDGSGVIVDGEALMFDFPVVHPAEEILIDPKVKNEMGKAGTFEFSMQPGNPWYNSLEQMTTIFRVDYDGETIFYGRVLEIDTDMWGKRQVHCEGALAFLLDTLVIATQEDERVEIELSQYIEDLIESHNSQVEPNKQFVLGEVPGHYGFANADQQPEETEKRKFGSGSWASTMNCLEDLTSKYGGYWRVRYVGGNLVLDWLLNYFKGSNNQELRVAENIIDISSAIDVNGIFTVLIPEGAKDGKPLYLDDIPKTIMKVPLPPKQKTPSGPPEA